MNVSLILLGLAYYVCVQCLKYTVFYADFRGNDFGAIASFFSKNHLMIITKKASYSPKIITSKISIKYCILEVIPLKSV